MASNAKHYIITAISLGVIAAASAGLIGVVNLITRDQIKKNEEKKFNDGITAIFGENKTTSLFVNATNSGTVSASYFVKNEEQSTIGWAIRTDGSNMYGKISMLVGFEYEHKDFIGIYVITNEQSYASTLVENYIDPLNGKEIQLDDVSCGATYGAKLVREMINDAQTFVDGIIYD